MISVATKNIMLTLVRRRTSSWYFGCLSTSETILSDTFYSPCYGDILVLGDRPDAAWAPRAKARDAQCRIRHQALLPIASNPSARLAELNDFYSTSLPKRSASEPGQLGRLFSGEAQHHVARRVYSKSLRTRRT